MSDDAKPFDPRSITRPDSALLLVDAVLVFAYVGIAWAFIEEDLWWVALPLLPFWIALIVVPDIVAYVTVRLRYDTTWFVMTDRSLRVRRGIWVIQETTITFENVQNLSVRRGPLERYFGIARLTVETAGAGADAHQGAPGGVANQGVIEGIRNAPEFKQRILARLEQSRSAGLGDEEHASAGWTAAQIDELRAIRMEVAKLR